MGELSAMTVMVKGPMHVIQATWEQTGSTELTIPIDMEMEFTSAEYGVRVE